MADHLADHLADQLADLKRERIPKENLLRKHLKEYRPSNIIREMMLIVPSKNRKSWSSLACGKPPRT